MSHNIKPKSLVGFVILITAILIALPFTCDQAQAGALDPPATDPWYCQSDHDWRFMLPDKVQHYYGSQLLVELGLHPATAFAVGFVYELYQGETGTGFSCRDMLANSVGLLAGAVNSRKFYLFMTYSTSKQSLELNAVLTF